MQQLVWKLLLCVVATVTASQTTWNSFTHHGKREKGCSLVRKLPHSMYKCPADRLDGKIQDAINQDKYFYIGYTSKDENSRYLKITRPKSKKWIKEFIKEKTFYALVTGTGVTERKLIEKYKNNRLCVNGPNAPTVSKDKGIVYVLVGHRQTQTGRDEDFFFNTIRSKGDIRPRSRPFSDVFDEVKYLLRLNRFE